MDSAAEQQALAEVRTRLEERFPELHPDVVAAAVNLAHSELDGPLRDFVPVLVEHTARERLAFLEASRRAVARPDEGKPGTLH